MYEAHGKQVMLRGTLDGLDEVLAHVADASSPPMAKRIARGLGALEYKDNCDATCSPMFHPEKADYFDFRSSLLTVIEAAEKVDKFKKIMFRGKEPVEVGLFEPIRGSVPATAGMADLFHGIIGTITEAGELAELLLAVIDGEKPDKINAIEETGDITWYLSRILTWSDSDFPEMFAVNINKLRGRHGTAFNMTRDHNRDLAAERTKLEQDAAQGELPVTDAIKAAIENQTKKVVGEQVLSHFKKPVGDVPGTDC